VSGLPECRLDLPVVSRLCPTKQVLADLDARWPGWAPECQGQPSPPGWGSRFLLGGNAITCSMPPTIPAQAGRGLVMARLSHPATTLQPLVPLALTRH